MLEEIPQKKKLGEKVAYLHRVSPWFYGNKQKKNFIRFFCRHVSVLF